MMVLLSGWNTRRTRTTFWSSRFRFLRSEKTSMPWKPVMFPVMRTPSGSVSSRTHASAACDGSENKLACILDATLRLNSEKNIVTPCTIGSFMAMMSTVSLKTRPLAWNSAIVSALNAASGVATEVAKIAATAAATAAGARRRCSSSSSSSAAPALAPRTAREGTTTATLEADADDTAALWLWWWLVVAIVVVFPVCRAAVRGHLGVQDAANFGTLRAADTEAIAIDAC
mmetsp:Transcript_15688/g.38083  ORF Transcript_15688/g.38083 Transcript_15688/m.38083 type:complete len:229 (-) Transcript_15688:69-755(-)